MPIKGRRVHHGVVCLAIAILFVALGAGVELQQPLKLAHREQMPG
jgi:hypothetical protein